MDAAFLQAQITATKTAITNYQTQIDGLMAGSIVSYTLDTGQTRQTVTKQTVDVLERLVVSLYNRLATLEARLNGSGVYIGRPTW